MKSLRQRLAIRAAYHLLRWGGLDPYFDVRASTSTKDVLGARIGKRMTLKEALRSELTAKVAPDAMLTLRMYTDLSRRRVDELLPTREPPTLGTPRIAESRMTNGRLHGFTSADLEDLQ